METGTSRSDFKNVHIEETVQRPESVIIVKTSSWFGHGGDRYVNQPAF